MPLISRMRRALPAVFCASALLMLTLDIAAAQESVAPTRGALFVAREGDASFASGEIARDGIIAVLPVRFRQVARVRTEVHRDAPLVFGHPGLAAGTPVFAASFTSEDPRMAGVAWCGVAVEGGTYCIFGMGENASIALTGDDYAPHVLNDYPDRASFFDVVADDAAANEIPPLELVYMFREWRRDSVQLRVGVRANGRISFLYNSRVSRAGDETALLRLRGGALRLAEGQDRRAAIATILAPPLELAPSDSGADALTPDDSAPED